MTYLFASCSIKRRAEKGKHQWSASRCAQSIILSKYLGRGRNLRDERRNLGIRQRLELEHAR